MIYRYKATIKGCKDFMREYELDSSMTLFQLRTFLNYDLGFTQNQPCMFVNLDAKGNVSRRIGLFDIGDGSMDKVSVENCISCEETVLRYVYNMSMSLAIELENVGTADFNPRYSYPMLVAEKGCPPQQFPTYKELMEQQAGTVVQDDADYFDRADDSAFEDSELPEGEGYEE